MYFHVGRSTACFPYQHRSLVPDTPGCINPFSQTDRISCEQRNVRRKSPALFRPAQAAG